MKKLFIPTLILWCSSLPVMAQTYRPQSPSTYQPYAPPMRLQADVSSRHDPVTHPYDERGRPNPDAFEWSGFSLGASLGTLGMGVEGAAYLTEWLNIRAVGNLLFFTYKDTIQRIDFDYDMEFAGVMLLFDFYPTQSGNFRVSAGVAFNSHEVDVKGTPRNNTQIGDNTYTPQQIGTIRGTAEYDSLAPYIGIGYGNPVKPDNSLTFIFDLGLLFQGYDLDLTSNGSAANDPQFRRDLNTMQTDIEDFLEDLKVYPVISFGVAYHF